MQNIVEPFQNVVDRCPACLSSDESTRALILAGSACPKCNLSPRAIADILDIEAEVNGPGLKAKAVAQRIQLDTAETNLKTCQLVLLSIRDHVEGLGPVLPHSGG